MDAIALLTILNKVKVSLQQKESRNKSNVFKTNIKSRNLSKHSISKTNDSHMKTFTCVFSKTKKRTDSNISKSIAL